MSTGTTTLSLVHRGRALAPTVMRLALGIAFVVAGAGKLLGVGPKAGSVGGFAGFLASLGVPAPGLMAWVVALVELGGGILLLLGLFVRIAALGLAIDMLVATVIVHVPNGYLVSNGGYELTLTLMLLSVAVVLSGPGMLSLETALFGRELLPKALAEASDAMPEIGEEEPVVETETKT